MGITVSVENGLQRQAGYWTIILPTLSSLRTLCAGCTVSVHLCHGMTSFLSFLIFVCPPPHLCHLLTPSTLVCLPSPTSPPTPRCTLSTLLCPSSDYPLTPITPLPT